MPLVLIRRRLEDVFLSSHTTFNFAVRVGAMAPHYDADNERAHAHDQQQTIPTEHDRLLGDQGHDSLYRTLSVRFVPNGPIPNATWMP